MRTSTSRQNILHQIRLIHALPNAGRNLNRLLIAQLRITLEIRLRIRKSRRTQSQETIHIPALNILSAGIHINREIKEITQRQIGSLRTLSLRRCQNIQTLKNQNIRCRDLNMLIRHDVVIQMRILRRHHTLSARLHLRHKIQQGAAIIRLRKTLTVHNAATLKLRIRVQETIRSHQLNLRSRRPATQKSLQNTSRRRLAHSNRTRHTNNERDAALRHMQKIIRHMVQRGCGSYIQIKKARNRQINTLHLFKVDSFTQTTKRLNFLSTEGDRNLIG